MSIMDRLFPPPDPGERLELVNISEGNRFKVDPGHFNQRLLSCYYGNLMRYYRRSALNQLLVRQGHRRPGGTFLDVGGNLGFYSLLAREAGFYPIVIEAEPSHASFLQRHPGLFPRVFPVAAGDEEGTARFFISQRANPGASSLVSPGTRPNQLTGGLYEGSMDVRVRRLDGLISELSANGGDIRVIKIDVEGFEAPVVRGMTGFLDQGHRPLIWCEVRGPDSNRAPDSYREVSGILGCYGYQPYRAEAPGQPAFKDNEQPLPQVFDLLFAIDRKQMD